MRRGIVLFLGLLLAPPALHGQSGAPALEPREQVAVLIRQALHSPEREESWKGLATGLATLVPVDPDGTEALLAARQIADSLSRAPAPQVDGEARRGVDGTESAASEPGITGARGVLTGLLELASRTAGEGARSLQRNGLVVPLLLALPMAGLLLVRSRAPRLASTASRRHPRRSAMARASGGEGSRPRRGPGDAKGFALALAESGLPPSEVARQTGMSQDAVAILLALNGRSGPATPPASARGRR